MSKRKSGVLMHVSSLPGPFGIGVFGCEALRFIDFLADAGFSVWQVLPFHPVNTSDSPYESESAFAGNFLFIDPRGLAADGLVAPCDVDACVYGGSPYTADYKFAAETRLGLLKKAFANIDVKTAEQTALFCAENAWVENYAVYRALKTVYGGKPWWEWDEKFRNHKTAAEFADKALIEFWKFVQYEFFRQWKQIKTYARQKGVKILGDMPIYVSMDSADVWGNPEIFKINPEDYSAEEVAGVPPDYFSEDGQLWGNPLYNWDAMEKDDYRWWFNRIKHELSLYDSLRIDHFRAFASYWAVDAKSDTAKNGVWRKGPGMKLFNCMRGAIGDHEIIAEDLGLFGDDVVKLLEDTGFPGVRVIQFGFEPDGDSTHLPHNYPKNCIACVGTHDNNTLLGCLWELTPQERRFALDYCGFQGDNWGEGGYKAPACRKIIEAVWRSSANTAVIAFQDLCGFGSDARMNRPGIAEGNWLFRTTDETIQNVDSAYFRGINRLFRRG